MMTTHTDPRSAPKIDARYTARCAFWRGVALRTTSPAMAAYAALMHRLTLAAWGRTLAREVQP